MNLVGITINHNTASIELREALHLSRDEIIKFISSAKESILNEGFVLSTCNRTEIFGYPKAGKLDFNHIANELVKLKPNENIEPNHFDKYFSCGAVKHIFRVASGIDSLVVGDSQILGQMKEAFEIAEDMNFVGSVLKRVFDTAIKVGKRAIKETEIGEGAVTISYAAVQIVEKIFANITTKNALVIGAGETGELAAIHLRDKGVRSITVTNRTIQKAERLANKVHGGVIPFNHFTEHLHKFDIIISATSSPGFIITNDDIKSVMKKRKGSPICLVDIAVPRDINPEVKNIDYVFYNDIDSLKVIVDQNIKKRANEIPKVQEIIFEELVTFFGWYNTLEVVPTIKTIRSFFDDISNDELQKIKHKVTEEDYLKIEEMTKRLIGRLLHNPTIKLREIAESGTHTQETMNNTLLIKQLFGLNGKHSDEK
ncbi:MAG: glutamyl-tRNA reductase [Ignavibacteria bacterium]|jgi:glutamyl-tRNA reductase